MDYKNRLEKLKINLANIDENEIQNYISKIDYIKKIYKLLPEEKTKNKTIPSIFNSNYKENFISDYLAYILNPNCTEYGFLILKYLINYYCKFEGNDSFNDIQNNVKTKVFREYIFPNRQRIDILIEVNNDVIIGIENKIFSFERKDQTIDYENEIKKIYPKRKLYLFYLTPKKENPSSKHFIKFSYLDLTNILKSLPICSISDIKQLILLQDFIVHVEEFIMKSNDVSFSEKSKLYIENYEMIEDIKKQFDMDAENYFNFIKQAFENIFKEMNWKIDFVSDRTYQFIYKDEWDKNGIFVHFEFWFDKTKILLENRFEFMIEVEGKNKDSFLKYFDTEYEKMKTDYQKLDILYRPKQRPIAIAFKDIELPFKLSEKELNNISDYFNNFINTYSFFIDKIDLIIKSLK